MSDPRTYGHIAYDAFRPEHAPSWAELAPAEKARWAQIGNAVARSVLHDFSAPCPSTVPAPSCYPFGASP